MTETKKHVLPELTPKELGFIFTGLMHYCGGVPENSDLYKQFNALIAKLQQPPAPRMSAREWRRKNYQTPYLGYSNKVIDEMLEHFAAAQPSGEQAGVEELRSLQRYEVSNDSEGDIHLWPSDSGDWVRVSELERLLAGTEKESK